MSPQGSLYDMVLSYVPGSPGESSQGGTRGMVLNPQSNETHPNSKTNKVGDKRSFPVRGLHSSLVVGIRVAVITKYSYHDFTGHNQHGRDSL